MSEKPAELSKKKWIEPVVAVLMALTTISTAWCSYHSATWTRRSNRLMRYLFVIYGFLSSETENPKR